MVNMECLFCLLVFLVQTSSDLLDPSQTLLWGNGLSKAQAGQKSSFHLQTRDASGKNITSEVSDILVKCISDSDAPYDFCIEDPTVSLIADGLFFIEFVVGRFWAAELDPLQEHFDFSPLAAEFFSHTNDRLHVKIDEVHVPGSPFYPLFLGDPTVSETHSQIAGSATVMIAGLPLSVAEFHKIRDVYGNNIRPVSFTDSLQSSLTLTTRSIGSSENASSAILTQTWMFSNWYINFVGTCFAAGHYRFQAWQIDDSAVKSFTVKSSIDGGVENSWYVECLPNVIDRISFESPAEGEVGLSIEIVVQALDKLGNNAFFKSETANLFQQSMEDQTTDEVVVSVLHESCNCSLVQSLTIHLDDQIPGRLTITFVSNKAGLHEIHFYHRGTEYTQQPIVIKVIPLVPDPNHARALSSDGTSFSETAAKANEEIAVDIELKDQYDNPTDGVKVDLAVRLIKADGSDPEVVTLVVSKEALDPQGLYHLAFKWTKAGVYDLLITYRGFPILNSPSTVIIQPSSVVDPARSLIVGSAIGVEIGMEQFYNPDEYRQIAGRNMSLIITAVDPYGNPQTETKPGFNLNQETKAAAVWMEKLELGDGRTKFYFAIEMVGVYYLQASYSETTVYQANLEVGPAGVLHSNCRVFGLQQVVAGTRGLGFLQVIDTYGNLYTTKYRTLINQSQFFIGFHHGGLQNQDTGQAKFEGYDVEHQAMVFSYNLTKSGDYAVSARWESWPMQGHGSLLKVVPGATSALQSIIADCTEDMIAGSELQVTVEARDQYNNTATNEDELEQVISVQFFTLEGNRPFPTETTVKALQPGLVLGVANITEQGVYMVKAFLRGEEIDVLAEKQVTIHPLGYSNSTSTIEHAQQVKSRTWNEILLFPRDKFGNSLSSSALATNLSFYLFGESSSDMFYFEETGISGQFRSQYRLNKTGTYQLVIMQASIAIHTSMKNISVVSSSEKSSASERNWFTNDTVVTGLMTAGCFVFLLISYWLCNKDAVALDQESDPRIEGGFDFEQLHTIDPKGKYDHERESSCEEERIQAYRN